MASTGATAGNAPDRGQNIYFCYLQLTCLLFLRNTLRL